MKELTSIAMFVYEEEKDDYIDILKELGEEYKELWVIDPEENIEEVEFYIVQRVVEVKENMN